MFSARFRYAIQLGVLIISVAFAALLLFSQQFGEATCPPRSSVTAGTRWTIMILAVLLAAYCVGSGISLRRLYGHIAHLVVWLSLAAIILGIGIGLEVTVRPSGFCF